MSKPVVVTLPNGAEYGVADVETARRLYPDGVVTRYQDGEPYVAPEPEPVVEPEPPKRSRGAK